MNKVAVIGIVGNTIFMSVDRFHVGAETVETEKAHYEFGAKGFNQALAAARLGAEVSFCAPVGDDYYPQISALCESEGIKPFLVKKDVPTSFGCVLTDKSGENRVSVFRGAKLTPEDIDVFRSEIESADILLINNEVDETVNLRAAKIAIGVGTKIIFNPAPCRKTDEELCELVYLFTPNEAEAMGLEAYPNVIQTLGRRGCLIKEENKTVPAVKLKAVDTTGAGDCFNGALAAFLAEGKTLLEAVEAAVLAAGLSVTKSGVVAAMPTRDDLKKFKP